MKLTFNGKVALVTGAAGGIGFATAKAFAEAGAQIVLADINRERIQSAAKELADAGHSVVGMACDVANEEDVRSLISRTVETYGHLDIAYNNVGIHASRTAPMAELDGADFDRVIAVNLKGTFNCLKQEVLQMQRQGTGGCIVNCSSQSGIVGTAGIAAYTASKHGVLGLTKSAALDYARHGIRINAICPGTSDTPMVQVAATAFPEHMANIINEIPLGRMGQAEEIASAVLWLCSDYAGFAIGQTVVMDGGYTIQ